MKSQITTSRCEHCGHLQQVGANFCSQCGRPIGSAWLETSSNRKEDEPAREAILLARARCTGTKGPFAIRFEQTARGVWTASGAVRISERQLSNSAFSSDQIVSSAVSPNYPGCPHCGADSRKNFAGISFVRCSCGELACSTGIIGAETLCPWCDRVGVLAIHGPLPVLGIKDR
jgi:TerY-C metal binding domain